MKRHISPSGHLSPKSVVLVFDAAARFEIEKDKVIEEFARRVWDGALKESQSAGFEDSLDRQARDRIALRMELLHDGNRIERERISILPPGARLSVRSLSLVRELPKIEPGA